MSTLTAKYKPLANGEHLYVFDRKNRAMKFIRWFGGEYDYCPVKKAHLVYTPHAMHKTADTT